MPQRFANCWSVPGSWTLDRLDRWLDHTGQDGCVTVSEEAILGLIYAAITLPAYVLHQLWLLLRRFCDHRSCLPFHSTYLPCARSGLPLYVPSCAIQSHLPSNPPNRRSVARSPIPSLSTKLLSFQVYISGTFGMSPQDIQVNNYGLKCHGRRPVTQAFHLC